MCAGSAAKPLILRPYLQRSTLDTHVRKVPVADMCRGQKTGCKIHGSPQQNDLTGFNIPVITYMIPGIYGAH